MEAIFAENGPKFIVAAAVVLLGLACLALVLWIMRGRPSSPFIRGGRNRTPRLAVLDAAAIDTRRRLVLVRRDDVEHLVMIGGPTDIVIESRIVGAQAAEPVKAGEPAKVVEAPRTAEPIKAAETPPAVRSAATPVKRPAAAAGPEGVSAMGKVLYADDEARPAPARTGQPAAAPQRPPQQQHRAEAALDAARQRVLPVRPDPAARPAPAGQAAGDFEKLLEAEMAQSAVPPAGRPAAKSREETEAEMARLLGEIAANRKG